MNAERSDSNDRSDARSSRLDTVFFWKEYRYSGKAVVEDRSDSAKWLFGRYSPESKFEQN